MRPLLIALIVCLLCSVSPAAGAEKMPEEQFQQQQHEMRLLIESLRILIRRLEQSKRK